VKRLFDIVVATLGIVLLSPLLAAIVSAIFLTMGRPILFRQVRPSSMC
jgi:lipopolysaccharide/colanic/teichoic acid biosynthesis glycosyltransferase